MEFARYGGQMLRRYQHVASAEIDLLIQLQGHRHGEGRLRKFAIVSHNRAHARFSPRGKRHNGIAGMDDTARDAPGESAKRGVWTNDGLHRKTKTLQGIVLRKRNRFEAFQQRRTSIPPHALAAVDDVVSLQRADGHALHVYNSQLRRERQEIVLKSEKNIFAILDQI